MPTTKDTTTTASAPAVARDRVVRLRLICLAPPLGPADAPGDFGVQDKAGHLLAGERGTGGALRYDLELAIAGYDATGRPRWRGAYLHGTPAAPFLYLSWRNAGPGGEPWRRRLKITLAPITRAMIERCIGTGGTLEAAIGGGGSGTVPLLDGGWTVREADRG